MNLLKRLIALVNPEDWKRAIALVIFLAYAYQLVLWPAVYWVMAALTAWTGIGFPPPALIPWEQLGAGTATLATVGGIETWRERIRGAMGDKEPA